MASNRAETPPIVHTVCGLHPRMGGLARTVFQLTAALAAAGEYRVILLSQSMKGGGVVTVLDRDLEQRIGLTGIPLAPTLGYPLKNELDGAIAEQCPLLLTYLGMWMPSNQCIVATVRMQSR